MRARLLKLWDRLVTSFWFLPLVMALLAVGLAIGTVSIDRAAGEQIARSLDFLYTGGAEGAGAVLGTIAGSMITIVGLVFSMTLVTLSLASSQFGPRLLRSFMRDTATQLVLGTFVATFLYCLLVLRTVRREDGSAFVPHLSVSLGVLFAVASLGVLIYFIHHVAMSIQADQVIARVASELEAGIGRLFPEQIGRGGPAPAPEPPDDAVPTDFAVNTRPILARTTGYVQFIDGEALMSVATRRDLIVHVDAHPGAFMCAGQPLARVWPVHRVHDETASHLVDGFVLGRQRTPGQDVGFLVHQLVEVAVRALSPGINDPFTAIRCIDRLGCALRQIAVRRIPSRYRRDHARRIRVVAEPETFDTVADAAFARIREYGRTSAAVSIRLLEAIAGVAEAAQRPGDRATLARHAESIRRGSRAGLSDEDDRRAVDDVYRVAMRQLHRSAG